MKDDRSHKLTDKEFWAILRKNGGIFYRTARAIAEKYAIDFSRQAVQQRANKKPKRLHDIKEQVIDIAEEGLQGLLTSEDEKIKLASIKYYLDSQGKKRGYNTEDQITKDPDTIITHIERTVYTTKSLDKINHDE